MGSYIFERSVEREGQEADPSLAADVELALAELDWVDSVSVRAGDGVAVADVHFDPDWPDQANPDLVAEVFARYGLQVVADQKSAGKVSAADPLRASESVGDGIDLFVFDE
jgi:hypothetical protein